MPWTFLKAPFVSWYLSTMNATAVNTLNDPAERASIVNTVALFVGIFFFILFVALVCSPSLAGPEPYDSGINARQMAQLREEAFSETTEEAVEEKVEDVTQTPSVPADKEAIDVKVEQGRTWKDRRTYARTWLARRRLAIRWFFASIWSCILRVFRIQPTLILTSPSGNALPLASTVSNICRDTVSEIPETINEKDMSEGTGASPAPERTWIRRWLSRKSGQSESRTWKDHWIAICAWLAQRGLAIRWCFARIGNHILRVLRVRPTLSLTSPSGNALPLPSTISDVGQNMVSEIPQQDTRQLTAMTWITWLWWHQQDVDERLEAEMAALANSGDNADTGSRSSVFGLLTSVFESWSDWSIRAMNAATVPGQPMSGGEGVLSTMEAEINSNNSGSRSSLLSLLSKEFDAWSDWFFDTMNAATVPGQSVSGGEGAFPTRPIRLSTIPEEDEEESPAMPGTLPENAVDDKTRVADASYLEEEDITTLYYTTNALSLAEEGKSPPAKKDAILPSSCKVDITDLLERSSRPISYVPGTPLKNDAVRFTPRPRQIPDLKMEEVVTRPVIPRIYVGRRNVYAPRRPAPAVRMPERGVWF
ncbi:hypothetical protein OE88DRAFT_1669218 [Heliocybe sulcata]|uniref:Transmembrane protein n=1 Tax=Heliocybe sulcata TaxID=5364 RepID=A0A5C3MKU6_9AGAM|nr:hypothetical protein OE88DRAFT_1669218 [Heliocybe sulcata]